MITPDDDDNDDDDDGVGRGDDGDGDDKGAYEFDTRANRGDNSEQGDQVLADVAEEEAVQVPQTGKPVSQTLHPFHDSTPMSQHYTHFMILHPYHAITHCILSLPNPTFSQP